MRFDPTSDVEALLNRMLNNGLVLEDNHRGGYVTHTTDATPGTESTVIHNLGFVPTGYLVVKQDKAGSVYTGATSWTREKLYLKSDVASLAVTLFVL